MRCETCGRPLEQEELRTAGGVQVAYYHARPGLQDHDPIPIPNTDWHNQVSVCDFCSEPDPTWMYPCKDIALGEGEGILSKNPENVSLGEWMACEACRELIQEDRWFDIEDRWWDFFKKTSNATEEMKPTLTSHVQYMWALFRTNRIGEPVLIAEAP